MANRDQRVLQPSAPLVMSVDISRCDCCDTELCREVDKRVVTSRIATLERPAARSLRTIPRSWSGDSASRRSPAACVT